MRQIIIRYPAAEEAIGAFKDFTGRYLTAGDATASEALSESPHIASVAGGTYAGASLSAQWLAIVLDAPSMDSVESALAQTQRGLAMLAP